MLSNNKMTDSERQRENHGPILTAVLRTDRSFLAAQRKGLPYSECITMTMYVFRPWITLSPLKNRGMGDVAFKDCSRRKTFVKRVSLSAKESMDLSTTSGW